MYLNETQVHIPLFSLFIQHYDFKIISIHMVCLFHLTAAIYFIIRIYHTLYKHFPSGKYHGCFQLPCMTNSTVMTVLTYIPCGPE